MPEENDTAIVSIFITAGICERRDRAGDGASAWGHAGASGQAARGGGGEPAHAGTMAAVVDGRVHSDRVLALGQGAFGGICGEEQVAPIVAGVFSKADGRTENHRPLALHPASDEHFSHPRNVRFAVLPQKTPVDPVGRR